MSTDGADVMYVDVVTLLAFKVMGGNESVRGELYVKLHIKKFLKIIGGED
jgi:hypothetical protein